MVKSVKKLLASVFSISAVLFSAAVPAALAEELVISGNGTGSVNEVVTSSNQQTNVTQNNDLNVNNNVDTDSNTGDNTANDNTGGETNVATGDISTSTEVTNTGNASVVNGSACSNCIGSITTVISGNGSNSQNSVNNTVNNIANININQTGSIINSLTTNGNTGGNTANGNLGNVSITTGNIKASTSVENGPVNISKVNLASGTTVDVILKIAGNGVSSVNTINLTINNDKNVNVDNYADFLNNIGLDLNTGGNSANNNVGDVKISTGDIWAEIKVKNLANISDVLIDCGCPKPNEEEPPIIPPGIVNPPTGGGGPGPTGGGSPSPSSAAAAVAAAIEALLPSTGTNWLVLALIGNIMMLFLGAYLRLRSGRSPGAVLA